MSRQVGITAPHSEMDVEPPGVSSSKAMSATGRKGSKKVRTGCITFKIRKVKCDEVKPFCLRCIKTGRKCDGYLDPKSMARTRRRSAGQSPQSSACFIYEWASQDEKRAFHFFQHVTAPSLSEDFDAFFWRVLVLQICQTQPAVKHAVLAVSSLHEGMLQAIPTATHCTDGSSFALQQYNKAISCLLDQMTEADANPLGPLLTCVLFVCIEFMQSKDKESLIHLEQGRQILVQLGSSASPTSPEREIIKQHLVPMYTRLSLTSFLLGGNPVPIPSELKTMEEVPCVFESIDEAQNCLYNFMDESCRFTRRTRLGRVTAVVAEQCPETRQQQQDYLMEKLRKIDVAWSLYQASSRSTNAQEGAIKLLSLHLRLNRVCQATALSTKETDYDAYLADFAAIIPLAAAFLDLADQDISTDRKYSAATGNPMHPSGRRTMFAFGLQVIAPLYYVATKCRHPVVRRAALDLMRRNPGRRENLWRADFMAELAARTIRLEEQSVVPDRSVSPPNHLFPDSFSQGLTPEMILAASIAPADTPGPGAHGYQMQEQQLHEPSGHHWFDLQTPGPSRFTSVPTTMAVDAYPGPSLAGDSVCGSVDKEMPIDPTLLLADTETSSPHSFASSFDDISHETQCTSPNMFITTSTSGPPITTTSPWQPIPYGPAAPSISLEPPTPVPGLPPYNPLTSMPSPRMAFEHHQQHGNMERQHSSAASSEEGDSSSYSGTTVERKHSGYWGLYNGPLSREAPFDLPEHLRVHDLLVGPEKEDGAWIMLFRKLGGEGGDWDVTTEFMPV